MYITVGPIHDKFNKACKTATTAIANYCGSITTIIIRQKKNPAYYNDNKDEKQFNIMLDFHLLPPFRDPSLPIAYLKSLQPPGRTNLVVS